MATSTIEKRNARHAQSHSGHFVKVAWEIAIDGRTGMILASDSFLWYEDALGELFATIRSEILGSKCDPNSEEWESFHIVSIEQLEVSFDLAITFSIPPCR